MFLKEVCYLQLHKPVADLGFPKEGFCSAEGCKLSSARSCEQKEKKKVINFTTPFFFILFFFTYLFILYLFGFTA